MRSEQQTDVNIRLWLDSDFPLLERLMGDPTMTAYLGGPEPPEQIRQRHERYCKLGDSIKGRMFVIVIGQKRIAVGSVGYWETDWQGQKAWETGWSVLPKFQGQGIATKAAAAVVEQARAERKHRFLHAFPSVDNGASNTICQKVGFTLQEKVEFEAWQEPGKFLHFNNWCLDLFADTSESP